MAEADALSPLTTSPVLTPRGVSADASTRGVSPALDGAAASSAPASVPLAMYRSFSAHVLAMQQLAHEHSQTLSNLYMHQALAAFATAPVTEARIERARQPSPSLTVPPATSGRRGSVQPTAATTSSRTASRSPPAGTPRGSQPSPHAAAPSSAPSASKNVLEKSPLGNDYGLWTREAVAAYTALERTSALLADQLARVDRPMVRCAAVSTELSATSPMGDSLSAGGASDAALPESLSALLHRAAPAASPERLARDAASKGDKTMAALLAAAQVIQTQQAQLAAYRRALVARPATIPTAPDSAATESLSGAAEAPNDGAETLENNDDTIDDGTASVAETTVSKAASVRSSVVSSAGTRSTRPTKTATSSRLTKSTSPHRTASSSPPAGAARGSRQQQQPQQQQPQSLQSVQSAGAAAAAAKPMEPSAVDAAVASGLIVATHGVIADDVVSASTFVIDAKAVHEALHAAAKALAGAAAAEHRERRRAAEAERHAGALRHLLSISRTAGAWAPASYAASAVNRDVDAMRYHYEDVLADARAEATAACAKATKAMKRFDALRRDLEATRASLGAAEARAAELADALATTAMQMSATAVPSAASYEAVVTPPRRTESTADEGNAVGSASGADPSGGTPLERLALASTSPPPRPTSPPPLMPRSRVSVTKQVRRAWEAAAGTSSTSPASTGRQQPAASRETREALRRDVERGVVGAGRNGSFQWKRGLRGN